MSPPRRAFVAVVVATLAGQLCAVAYEIVVAGRFGTRREADVLAVALMVVTAVGNELVTWVSALFVPHYAEARAAGGVGAGANFFRGTLAVLLVGGGVLAIILVAGAPLLVDLLLPDVAARPEGTALLRLFSPLVLLMPLAVLLSGVLQSGGRFVTAGTRQFWWYGGALAAVLLLADRSGTAAVPIGMVVGLVVFSALLAVDIRIGIDLPRGGEPAGRRLRGLAGPLGPLALAAVANYVNVTLERGIAARLPDGSVAALTYAFRLLNFPVNLFFLNAAAMIFPALALHAAQGEMAAFESLTRRTLRLVFVFTVPLAGLSMALGEPVIQLLLERGAFTAESTRLTATALAWYAPALVGIAGGQMVMSRVYLALHEVRRMVAIHIAAIGVNMVLMVGLTAVLGFRGLPLAASVTALTLFGLLLAGLGHRLPGLGVGAVLASAVRALAAGSIAVLCAWATHRAGGGGVGALLLASAAGLLGYGVALFLIGRDDARLALGLVVPRWIVRATNSGRVR